MNRLVTKPNVFKTSYFMGNREQSQNPIISRHQAEFSSLMKGLLNGRAGECH